MENNPFDYAIVGGGILGAAIAYRLSQKFPEKSIVLFEKEKEFAAHQTGNNSGVIHSGLYYKPGSRKATLCATGKKMLVDFAQQHQIPHEVCGKVVVATHKSQLPHLEKIYQNGLANQCEGIKYISSDEIKKYEPYCEGVKGIYVPTTGIIDYKKFTEKLIELVRAANPANCIFLETEVIGINQASSNTSTISTNRGRTFSSKQVITCGGLFADQIALKDHLDPKLRIVPFRGDYYKLTEKGKHKVKNLIYPVPDPSFPFLGVHFTRMTDGEVECGPNAVFSFKREGYDKWSFRWADAINALSYKGTWKLFSRHWRQGLEEYKRAFSKRLFLRSLQQLIPSLEPDDIQPARAGVRAQALDPEGNLVYDFELVQRENHLHLLNAPSPAATASLAIADYVISKL